VPDFCVGAMTA